MKSYRFSLAPAKCQHIPIVCHHVADNASNVNYIGNQQISSMSGVCDLDVVISSNLKWQQHVCSIVSKDLFIDAKFYTVSVAPMFGFCSKHILLTLDHR